MGKKTIILVYFLFNILSCFVFYCQPVLATESKNSEPIENTNQSSFSQMEISSNADKEKDQQNERERLDLRSTNAKSALVKDDFYILKPIVTNNNYLVADVSASTGNLIVWAQHGLGNQLFGIEWRSESDAYILFLSKDKQQLLKPTGTAIGSKVIAEKQKTTVNNLSRFSNDYLWDIVPIGENFIFVNRQSGLALTVSSAVSGGELLLQTQTNEKTQQIKLEGFNGYYLINSLNLATSNSRYVFDIQGGVGLDKEVIAYKDYGNENQKWFIVYYRDFDGYVIGNARDKSILISSEQGLNKSPITKTFDPSKKIDKKFRHVFTVRKNYTTERYLVEAGNYHITTTGGSRELKYVENSTSISGHFELLKQGSIVAPVLSNFQLDKQKNDVPEYFVGEKINYSAEVESVDFKNISVSVRTDTDDYHVLESKLPVIDNKVKVSSVIDTQEMKEGEHFVELLAKGEGIFVSNSLAAKVHLVYPTPKAEAVAQKVYRNRKISELNGLDFVKNVTDEMGNDIDVKLVSLDTSKVGETTAVVSLKNQFKETLMDVPVEIIKEPAKLKVNFVNEVDQLLSGYTLELDAFVGDPIDLTQNTKVIEQLSFLAEAGYELVMRPVDESEIAINATEVTVQYKLQGLVSLYSVPEVFDFGSISYDAVTQRIEKPSFDKPLIVIDTRVDKSNDFRMTATLTTAMQNKEGKMLNDGLIYVYKGEEKILNHQEQIIFANNSDKQGIYNITNTWEGDSKSDGIKLQVNGTDMLYTGTYYGVLTWKLMVDEP